MQIKQQEKSEIQDIFDKSHISVAFDQINELAAGVVVDTEQLKTYIEKTKELLSKVYKDIESLEKQKVKAANVEKFNEKLFGFDEAGA